MARRPQVVINPYDDEPFVALVEQLAPYAMSPDELEAMLRAEYPAAAVRQRDLSAEPIVVWYVYRDGHWVRPRGAL